jgi:hypothetical protein
VRIYRVSPGGDKLLYQGLWFKYFCTLFSLSTWKKRGIAENCQSVIVFCVGRRFGKGIRESSHRNGMEDGDAYLDSGFPK